MLYQVESKGRRKIKGKSNCTNRSFILLILMCLPIAVLIGYLLSLCMPIIYGWSLYVISEMENIPTVWEHLEMLYLLVGGMFVFFLSVFFFILIDLIIYSAIWSFNRIVKCYCFKKVIISISALKAISIVVLFYFGFNFSTIELDFMFIITFLGVGIFSTMFISTVVIPANYQ